MVVSFVEQSLATASEMSIAAFLEDNDTKTAAGSSIVVAAGSDDGSGVEVLGLGSDGGEEETVGEDDVFSCVGSSSGACGVTVTASFLSSSCWEGGVVGVSLLGWCCGDGVDDWCFCS